MTADRPGWTVQPRPIDLTAPEVAAAIADLEALWASVDNPTEAL